MALPLSFEAFLWEVLLKESAVKSPKTVKMINYLNLFYVTTFSNKINYYIFLYPLNYPYLKFPMKCRLCGRMDFFLYIYC